MVSKRIFALTVPAEEFSIDGFEWEPVPKDDQSYRISIWALVIKNLQEESLIYRWTLLVLLWAIKWAPLESKYISGRVDKACLGNHTDVDPDQDVFEEREDIGLV